MSSGQERKIGYRNDKHSKSVTLFLLNKNPLTKNTSYGHIIGERIFHRLDAFLMTTFSCLEAYICP